MSLDQTSSNSTPDQRGLVIVTDDDGWVSESGSSIQTVNGVKDEAELKARVSAPLAATTPTEPPAEPTEPIEPAEPLEPTEEPAEPIAASIEPVAAEPVKADAATLTPKKAKRGTFEQGQERHQKLQRDINAATKELHDLQRTKDATLTELRQAQATLEALKKQAGQATAAPVQAQPPPTQTDAPDPRPTWGDGGTNDYEKLGKDYGQFTEDQARWAFRDEARKAGFVRKTDVEQQFATRDAATRQETEQQQAARISAQVDAQFRETLVAARQKYADFDQKLDQNLWLPKLVWDVVKPSPQAGELLLYFSAHPEDVNRIARLHPIHAFQELGRIQERVAAANSGSAPRREVSRAKPPVQPVVGSAPAASGPEDGLESDDLLVFAAAEAKREAQMQRARGF